MLKIYTANKTVACTPPENRSITTKKESGFATIEQKTSLVELEVVFDASDLEKGPYLLASMKIYVKGESVVTGQWAKKEYELDGKKFVLVPVNEILLAKVEE